MKKTNKENPLTTFRKANEARKTVVMKSLKKAQAGISTGVKTFNASDLDKEYANAPMVGAKPEYVHLDEMKRVSEGKAPRNKTIAEENYYNDPRFSKNVEATDAFYKKEKAKKTLFNKGFSGRSIVAQEKFNKANPNRNMIQKKGGVVKRKK